MPRYLKLNLEYKICKRGQKKALNNGITFEEYVIRLIKKDIEQQK